MSSLLQLSRQRRRSATDRCRNEGCVGDQPMLLEVALGMGLLLRELWLTISVCWTSRLSDEDREKPHCIPKSLP